jgi:UDP-2-acetamido-3-amino-2,3-dideoxy-glucuronate N-acetyltransferase
MQPLFAVMILVRMRSSVPVLLLQNGAPYALVVGNPSKQTGWMSEYGHKLFFNEDGFAFCKESNEKYQLKDGVVSKVL